MTLLLGVVAFGFAICAYVLHEVRKAPFGIEVGGRFFISENRAPSTTFRPELRGEAQFRQNGFGSVIARSAVAAPCRIA